MNMISKNTLVKIIRTIATEIADLDQDELEKLIDGDRELSSIESKNTDVTQHNHSIEIEPILQRLNQCNNRDEARQILHETKNKNTLTLLAKNQSIHIAKHDKREDIENKIIEFIIGSKLRTDAIKTLNLNGSNGDTSKQND